VLPKEKKKKEKIVLYFLLNSVLNFMQLSVNMPSKIGQCHAIGERARNGPES
jgi:hypothetical protein